MNIYTNGHRDSMTGRVSEHEMIPKDFTLKVTEVNESSKLPNCDMKFETEKGLKFHIGRSLKSQKPEKERSDKAIKIPLLALTAIHETSCS